MSESLESLSVYPLGSCIGLFLVDSVIGCFVLAVFSDMICWLTMLTSPLHAEISGGGYTVPTCFV